MAESFNFTPYWVNRIYAAREKATNARGRGRPGGLLTLPGKGRKKERVPIAYLMILADIAQHDASEAGEPLPRKEAIRRALTEYLAAMEHRPGMANSLLETALRLDRVARKTPK